MNKVISIILTALTIIFVCLPITNAKDGNVHKILQEGNRIYYSDGSYIEIGETREISPSKSVKKTLRKPYTYYNSNHEKIACLTVTGTFYINIGVSVTCTQATYDTAVYKSGWSFSSPSASYSNHTTYATATATATLKKKVLGITVQSIPLSASITCYRDGSYA